MTTELTKAAQQALEQLEFLNACYPHKTAADAIAALQSALTQRPAAQTEREADGYGSTDLPWSFTVCRELEPQEKRLMSMLVSAFGSDHPAIDDMTHLILNRPTSLPAPQQATPASAPQSLLMRLAGIAAECSDPDTTDALDALIAATQQATPGWSYAQVRIVDENTVDIGRVVAFADEGATPEPVGEHAHIEVVGEVVTTEDGNDVRWSIEGGVDAIPEGMVLLITDRQITDDTGSGEVYTRPAPGGPEGWTASAYKVAGFTVQSMDQLDGTSLWKIADASGNVLNKHGEWEWEPMPSSRDDAFLARCRYATLAEASAALAAAKAKGGEHA